ncbi:tetratricopeptide repeat protein [Streptomyces griseus]|uniref:tetratricopeptide repeat protein n=1 Tax=Streptomyces griseus TaxID=1911 RepID=UPI0036570E37
MSSSIVNSGGSNLDLLRTPPTGEGVRPPVVTKTPYLPLNELIWSDVERLFLRLVELRSGRAEKAQLYGTHGQGQAGIDLFIRNAPAPSTEDLGSARRYTTLQSKRVATLSESEINNAVEKFLKGEWATRSQVFIYATTHDLRPTQLADTLNRQADRLEKKGIRLVWWGRERVSDMLRELPQVVDDFFGRQWVKSFCGTEAASVLDRRDASAQKPRLIGLMPPAADAFQDRGMTNTPTVYGQEAGSGVAVLTGMGGVGKTQIAARRARQALDQNSVDLVVWVTATSRQNIRLTYGRAGVIVAGAEPTDPEAAPEVFQAWLNTTDCRWLIVLDNLLDPTDLRSLWPPERPGGHVIVTTQRRDPALRTSTRRVIDVGPFTSEQSLDYLTRRFQIHDLVESQSELNELAEDLGHLPLALAQAASYLIDLADTDLTISQYRALLRERYPLNELAPPPEALPDDQEATLAAVLNMSLTRADHRTRGLATPLLQMTSFLNPAGIPTDVFTTQAAVDYLVSYQVPQPSGEDTTSLGRIIGTAEVEAALRILHRLSLINRTTAHDNKAAEQLVSDHSFRTVQVHALTQHSAHDTVSAAAREALARTTSRALLQAWPDIETDLALAQALRSNTTALLSHAATALWSDPTDDASSVLFRAAYSYSEAGMLAASSLLYSALLDSALECLGNDHHWVLLIRGYLARVRGEAGDAAGAVEAYQVLLINLQRILGTEHPDTLTVRQNLAHWRGRSGDFAGSVEAQSELLANLRHIENDHLDLRVRNDLAQRRAENGDIPGSIKEFEALLADWRSALGDDHHGILIVRGNLAHWRGELGNPASAVTEYEELLTDQRRILGPSHADLLITRSNLAHWRGESGDAAGAIKDFEALLAEQQELLGPHHPDTFNTRHNLATRKGQVGSAPHTVKVFEELLADQRQALGTDHPDVLLATRSELADWRAMAGDISGAVSDYEDLLTDQLRTLGADHPVIRRTRALLALWRNRLQTGPARDRDRHT